LRKDNLSYFYTMTIKGELMTAKGEIILQPKETKGIGLQVQPWRLTSHQNCHFIDSKGNSPIRETDQNHPIDESPKQERSIVMIFVLESKNLVFPQISGTDFPCFQSYQHNLWLFSDILKLDYRQQETESEIICIYLNSEFLFRYLPSKNAAFDHFTVAYQQGKTTFLSKQHLPITPKILSALKDLIKNSKKEHNLQIYLEGKIIELLAHQFTEYEKTLKSHKAVNLREEDLEKIHQVRDILINNMHKEISLKELAHEVGTNEFNLKKRFREVFGQTVFGYWHNLKMEKAKYLLLNQQWKIADIANEIGYKHATHFTNAFKKHFGYLPNKLKFIGFSLWSELDFTLLFTF
jgi:AraC-like DNA-binding protein